MGNSLRCLASHYVEVSVEEAVTERVGDAVKLTLCPLCEGSSPCHYNHKSTPVSTASGSTRGNTSLFLNNIWQTHTIRGKTALDSPYIIYLSIKICKYSFMEHSEKNTGGWWRLFDFHLRNLRPPPYLRIGEIWVPPSEGWQKLGTSPPPLPHNFKPSMCSVAFLVINISLNLYAPSKDW